MCDKKVNRYEYVDSREFFFFKAEDGIQDFCLSRELGDVYKRKPLPLEL